MMIRKKLLIVASFAVLSFTGNAQVKPFTIKGSIAEKTSGLIYLQYHNGENKPILDSALIDKGAFLFNGNIDGVTEAKILAQRRPAKSAEVFSAFLCPGSQIVALSANDLSDGIMSGTAVAEEMKKLKESKTELQTQFAKLLNAYVEIDLALKSAAKNKADEAMIAKLKEDLESARSKLLPIHAQLQAKDREFMDKYPTGYVTASLLKENLKLKDARQRYEMLSSEVANSRMGKAIKKELDVISSTAIGAFAPNFTATELRGEQLSLVDYKDKYVLLDFWASWCVPCRAGHPHLLSLYTKYKDKGFEIIGVADDDNAVPAWKKAIEDDKIGLWKHVLRGLIRKSPGEFDRSKSIADKYSVGGYPTKILIDPKGVIIGRYSGSEGSLDEKLAAIFDNKTN